MNGRMRLEYQADCIEATLAHHKVNGRVAGGTVTSRFVRFDLLPEPGVRIRRVQQLAEELALSLSAPTCRVLRRGGRLQVEVPRDDPRRVSLLEVCHHLQGVPPATALLGLDPDSVPVLLRLPSPDVAHVLIAGNTGSGKTALARTMALSLAMFNPPHQLQMVLIDPKRRGFAPLTELPHLLAPLVDGEDRAEALLTRLVEEMERRDREGRDSPRVVVFVDELADLCMVGGQRVQAAVTRLAQRGREAGIHLVACTQRPTARAIGALVKSNFPVRVVGSVASAEDAKVAAGLPQTGAERLLGGGDFVVVARGEQIRIQAAFIGAQQAARVAQQMAAGKRAMGDGLGRRVLAATKRLVSNLPALADAPR